MTGVPDVLFHIIHLALWVAAICATAYPLIYAWVPWYRSVLGRALMLYAVSFAVILDLTLLFAYWTPDHILVAFWIEVVIFGVIAVASVFLTGVLLRGIFGKKPAPIPQEHQGVIEVTVSATGKKTYSLAFEGDIQDLDQNEYVTFKVEDKQ